VTYAVILPELGSFMATASDFPNPLRGLKNGIIELTCHTVMVGAILLAIKALEAEVKSLWGGPKLLFGRFQLEYVFDGADLALLLGFLIYGIWSVLSAYMRKRE
jgi:hypothetical protein